MSHLSFKRPGEGIEPVGQRRMLLSEETFLDFDGMLAKRPRLLVITL